MLKTEKLREVTREELAQVQGGKQPWIKGCPDLPLHASATAQVRVHTHNPNCHDSTHPSPPPKVF